MEHTLYFLPTSGGMLQAADALLKTIYQLGGDAYADQIGKDSGLLLRR